MYSYLNTRDLVSSHLETTWYVLNIRNFGNDLMGSVTNAYRTHSQMFVEKWQCTESMNLRKSGLINSGYKRWNSPPSLLLFFQPQEVWAMTPQSFTSAWHRCLPRNGTSHTARPYVGYGTAWAIPSFAHPSKQSEVLDPLRDMQWGHQQPSTLLSLNHTSQRMTSDLYCTSSKHYIKYKYYLNFCLFFFPPICTISCSRFITFQGKKKLLA